MDWLDWILLVGRVVVVFFLLLLQVLILVWVERKVIADMQTRMGPMRAGPRGVLITLADGIKLFFKEGITPTLVDRPVYAIAPIIAILPAFLSFAVIPFGTGVELFGRCNLEHPQVESERAGSTSEPTYNEVGLRPRLLRLAVLELPLAGVPGAEVVDDLEHHRPGCRVRA